MLKLQRKDQEELKNKSKRKDAYRKETAQMSKMFNSKYCYKVYRITHTFPKRVPSCENNKEHQPRYSKCAAVKITWNAQILVLPKKNTSYIQARSNLLVIHR